MTNSNDLAVLVSSCDRFADVWPVFAAFFDRFWPDCPYSAYIISNGRTFDHPRLGVLDVGPDRHWASNMKRALGQVDSPRILYMQEDFLLTGVVHTARVESFISIMEQRRAAYFRLVPVPPANERIQDERDYGTLKLGTPYRVALQCSLWNKEVLQTLLVDGETGWDMEFKGSARSNLIRHEFLSVRGRMKDAPVPYDVDSIHRGKWRLQAVRHCRQHGVELDLSVRPAHGLLYEMYKRSPVSAVYGWHKAIKMWRELKKAEALGA